MPREKGPEWEYVVVLPPDDENKHERVQCKLCQHVFQGGASRIRGHFLKDRKLGVAGCTAEQQKLEPVAQVMRSITDSSKQQQHHQQELRALDRATSSVAAASSSKKQRTIAESFGSQGVTKAECDAACGRLCAGEGLPGNLVNSPYFRDFVDKVRCMHALQYSITQRASFALC